MIVIGVLLALALALWPSRRAAIAQVSRAQAHPDARVQRVRQRVATVLAYDVRWPTKDPDWVADFAEMSAIGLEAGLAPTQAAMLACDVGPGGDRSPAPYAALRVALDDADASGSGLGRALKASADGDANAGLDFLAVAWHLADDLGIPAAYAARTCAQVLRDRDAAADRQAALSAGPRTSMWLLTLLPLSGPLVATILGFPVGEVYSGVPAMLSAGVGIVLTAAGWMWSRRVLARSTRRAVIT